MAGIQRQSLHVVGREPGKSLFLSLSISKFCILNSQFILYNRLNS